MNKHTPGPWTLSSNRAGHAIVCASGKTVAAAHLLGTIHPREEVEANALLIAAAPDLLAALKKALNHPLVRIPGDLEIVMRAAISKATGGQDNG
jgi:Asp/Glu/hydantoin racemase